jgi:hypothetical protein
VVGAVLELPDVTVLEHLLEDDSVLLLSDKTDEVDMALVALALARVFIGVGGGGVAAVDGLETFVRSFLACFVLIFSSSSEDDNELKSLLGTARATAPKVGTRFSGWRVLVTVFGGDAPIPSSRRTRCMREISASSDRDGRYWSEELESVDNDRRRRRG